MGIFSFESSTERILPFWRAEETAATPLLISRIYNPSQQFGFFSKPPTFQVVRRTSISYEFHMGNKVVTFTEEQLEDYQDCTFFTRKEILRVQKRFREINPEVVPKGMTKNEPFTISVKMEEIFKLPEFRENPFRRRICEVFSHDGKGNLTFEDFLDLLSVFSEHAPRDIKVFYAFKIYDFDGDQHLGPNDLELILRLLTRNELSQEEMGQICEKVIEESDVDGDGKLSFMEFEHVITRAPEFLATFHIRI